MRRQQNELNSEKEKSRSTAKRDEEELSQTLKSFSKRMLILTSCSSSINSFLETNKVLEMENIVENIQSMQLLITKEKESVEEAMSEIEVLKGRVGEQERYRKSILDNLKLLETRKQVMELKEEYKELKLEFKEMAGSSTPGDDYAATVKRKNQLLSEKARREGRVGELKNQQKELKVRTIFQV